MDKDIYLARGKLGLIDALTSGALDKYAHSVLGIHTPEESRGSEPYMSLDTDQQDRKH